MLLVQKQHIPMRVYNFCNINVSIVKSFFGECKHNHCKNCVIVSIDVHSYDVLWSLSRWHMMPLISHKKIHINTNHLIVFNYLTNSKLKGWTLLYNMNDDDLVKMYVHQHCWNCGYTCIYVRWWLVSLQAKFISWSLSVSLYLSLYNYII